MTTLSETTTLGQTPATPPVTATVPVVTPPASQTTATPPVTATPPATTASPNDTPQLDVPQSVDPLLVTILSWPRKHNSFQELQFCKWLREKIIEAGFSPAVRTEGCISVEVPYPDDGRPGPKAKPTTLFSSHVDTVDWELNGKPGDSTLDIRNKKLVYDPIFGHITLDKDSPFACLGADDGAGVWIMLRMIMAKVPGTYLFHRGEECGGIGSKAMAIKEKTWLENFDCAVAFDRANDFEVITHQRGHTECASNKFAAALAAELNARLPEGTGRYTTSTRGVYTDTYEYRTIIAECVNIGVGYEGQHNKGEMLDYAHCAALMDACCAAKWDSLPIDRDPTKAAPAYSYSGYHGRSSWPGSSQGPGSLFDHLDSMPGKATKKKKKVKPTPQNPFPNMELDDESQDLAEMSMMAMYDYIERATPSELVGALIDLRVRYRRAVAEVAEYRRLIKDLNGEH